MRHKESPPQPDNFFYKLIAHFRSREIIREKIYGQIFYDITGNQWEHRWLGTSTLFHSLYIYNIISYMYVWCVIEYMIVRGMAKVRKNRVHWRLAVVVVIHTSPFQI